MGRVSTKKDKNIYQLRREELGYSREKAAEILQTISPERIEKIESGKMFPHPDEVLTMSKEYKMPNMCNYYCSNECPIGKQYVPEIKIKDLSQIVLEILASLNYLQRNQERFIEITADGSIDESEIADFIKIQDELERISVTVETLQLWSEQMLANNVIDSEIYRKFREKMKNEEKIKADVN